MLTESIALEAYQNMMKNHADALASLNKKIEAIKKVEAAGLPLVKYSWDIPYTFHIKRSDLPLLRKVVGRVQVTSTDVPYNYDTTQEVDVTIKPMAEEFSCLRFSYRKPYKGDGKCKVVEQTSTYRTLVCTK